MRDLNAGLSAYDKAKLYLEIVDYIEAITKDRKIVDVKKIVLNKFTTSGILFKVFDASINQTSKTFNQARLRLVFVFFALYSSESFRDLVNHLQDTFPANRDKIENRVENMQEELKRATRIDLNDHWLDKIYGKVKIGIKKEKEKIKIASNDDYDINSKKQEVEEIKEDNKEELKNTDNDIIPDKTQTLVSNEMKTSIINNFNFENAVIENLKVILEKIGKMTSEQRKILSQGKKITITDEQLDKIFPKAKKILDLLILRTKKNEITIPKNANPLRHATVIIYAVSHSNEDIPKLSGKELTRLIGAKSLKTVNDLYNRWYKNLAPKLDFNFQSTRMGREPISLYFFEQLIDTKKDLSKLISHLERIDAVKLVSRLKEIINNADTSLTLTVEERNLYKQFTEREIKDLQDMINYYADTFDKYFFDLVEIIKLLIISNKSHKIIGADFSVAYFVRFFMSKEYDLSLSNDMLNRLLSRIFSFLKSSNPTFSNEK